MPTWVTLKRWRGCRLRTFAAGGSAFGSEVTRRTQPYIGTLPPNGLRRPSGSASPPKGLPAYIERDDPGRAELGFTQIDQLEPDGEFVRRITLNPMTTGLVMADLALPDGRLVGHFRRLGDDDEQSEEGGRPVHIFPLDGSEAELLYTAWELPEEDESSVSESASSGMVMRMSAGRAFEPLLEFDILTDREGVEGRTFADEVPMLYRLKVDWEDRIWLQRRGPTGQSDGPTDIVTPDGDYIGTLPPDGLRTPDAFGPDGLLAYIEHDDMDVSTVRVIRLVALEPGG